MAAIARVVDTVGVMHQGQELLDRWRAVMARDTRADGRFLYAVQSTGIYCKPSCPSRRPRRHQVAFFDAAAEAERAGYRACKRCRPNMPATKDPWIARVDHACQLLARSDQRLSLAELAKRIGGSRYHLQRNFKRVVGVTPRAYLDARRLGVVKRALRRGDPVTGAVFEAGYGSSSRFYERASAKLGMAPSTYRRGGVGMKIRYTIVDSALGRLLVAATDRGVCAVAIGRADTDLVADLAKEYPAATMTAATGSLVRGAKEMVARVAGRAPRADLPLDIQATAFQWQVWQALAAIPFGETRTYGEVAAAIGRPHAVRAVARACATNPVAVAIPCHRVIAASGAISGYRWGIDRKRALLARERA
jgi:AraC family transcriptional regulator of adaptative response/methylated-DNA-[protein]-cysteine methyltransferase